MTVSLVPRVQKGWKAGENNRFGVCFTVQFKDPKTGKVMFTYAPLLEDRNFWNYTFAKLITLDELHKQAINVCVEFDPKFTAGNKECGEKHE